jgi:hypothetical protein
VAFKIGNLTLGMDAGIGASRSDKRYAASRYCFQGFFNFSYKEDVVPL